MSSIALSHKAQKLMRLCEIEGFENVEGPVRKVVGIRSGIISEKLFYHIMRQDQIVDRWVL